MAYGSDKASSKYSPLDQIHKDNVQNLQIAWRWKSIDNEIVKQHQLHAHAYEVTPLMVDGVLYTSTSLSQVAAIDAASGKTIWVYDPKTYELGLAGRCRVCAQGRGQLERRGTASDLYWHVRRVPDCPGR